MFAFGGIASFSTARRDKVIIPPCHRELWGIFVRARAVDPTPRFLEAFHFDDNERSANELAKLVFDGKKRATASLLWTYESEKQRIPEAGDLSIVTDFIGVEVGVIETTQVDIVAFSDISDEFAATEGEGDGSLTYWRRAHEAFFGRECQRISRQPAPNMPVVCERFEVVFRRGAARDAKPISPRHVPPQRVAAQTAPVGVSIRRRTCLRSARCKASS